MLNRWLNNWSENYYLFQNTPNIVVNRYIIIDWIQNLSIKTIIIKLAIN